MIGILNTGGEYAEYYSANPSASGSSQPLFSLNRKPRVTYSKGGRVFVNGQPQVTTSPKEMWENLLTRAISNSAIVATLKAAGLESKPDQSTTKHENLDLRKVNSEANIPELVVPVKAQEVHSGHHRHPMKICRRRRRSSSC